MTTWPQEEHADLGLVEDDHTEDLHGHFGHADSKEPPTTSTAKHLVEGSESTTNRK